MKYKNICCITSNPAIMLCVKTGRAWLDTPVATKDAYPEQRLKET